MSLEACRTCGSLFSQEFGSQHTCPNCRSKEGADATKFMIIAAVVVGLILFSISPGILASLLIGKILSRAFEWLQILAFALAMAGIIVAGSWAKFRDWKKCGYVYLGFCVLCTAILMFSWEYLHTLSPAESSVVKSEQTAPNVPTAPETKVEVPSAASSMPSATTASVPTVEPSVPASTPASASASAPIPAPVPAKADSVSPLPAGFSINAPIESKVLLMSMLAEPMNALKLAETKGEVERIAKPATGDRKAARAYNDKGLSALKAEKYADATDLLQKAVVTDPSDIEVRNNYVYALLKSKNLAEAEKEVGLSLTMSPGRSSAWANLAEIYAEKGNSQTAASALIVAFQFSSNKDKTLTFLKDKAESTEIPAFAEAAKSALKRLKDGN